MTETEKARRKRIRDAFKHEKLFRRNLHLGPKRENLTAEVTKTRKMRVGGRKVTKSVYFNEYELESK